MIDIQQLKPVQEIKNSNFSQWFISTFNCFPDEYTTSDGNIKSTKNCICFDSKTIEYQGIKIYYELYIQDDSDEKFGYQYPNNIDQETKSYLSNIGIHNTSMIYSVLMTLGIDKNKIYSKEDLFNFGYTTDGKLEQYTECNHRTVIKTNVVSFLKSVTEYTKYDTKKEHSIVEEFKEIVNKKLAKYNKINQKKEEEKYRKMHYKETDAEFESNYEKIITDKKYIEFLNKTEEETKDYFKNIDQRYKKLLDEGFTKFQNENKNVKYPIEKRYATRTITITEKDAFKEWCKNKCADYYGTVASEYLSSDNKKEYIKKYIEQQKVYFKDELHKNLIEIRNTYLDSKDYTLVYITIGVHQTADLYIDIHSSSNPNKLMHIQTFGAGGNNIQRYHVRSKNNFVQDRKVYHED